jgi:hypothetical protein
MLVSVNFSFVAIQRPRRAQPWKFSVTHRWRDP